MVEDIHERECAVKSKKRKYLDFSGITSEDESETCQNINSMCPAKLQTLSIAPQEGMQQEIHELSDTSEHGFQMKTPNNVSHNESQFTLNDSSVIIDLTEEDLCVKCNEDGQLLVCNTDGCYMVVHEDCLGFSANLDDEGNFYCPLCAYSTATSKYLEAKKKVFMARKELASFLSPNLEHRS